MNVTTREEILPMSPQQLQLLVALAAGRATGYELRRQVREDTAGAMQAASGAVYPALRRLRQMDLIREAESGIGLRPGPGVRVYELSGLGWQVLAWELERVGEVVRLGRERRSDARVRGWL